MKKIIFALLAMFTMSIEANAQAIEVYKNGELVTTYVNGSDTYRVQLRARTTAEQTAIDNANLLSGKFSVSATKQVQFTKGNLYWDGSAFHLEKNQKDFPSEWDDNHVGHFAATSATDYNLGTAEYLPYNKVATHKDYTPTDKLWCGVNNPLTVQGTSGLYALTKDEWDYLLNKRTMTNGKNRYKCTTATQGTVDTPYAEKGLFIYPDDYNGSSDEEYWYEISEQGVVFLPACGYRENEDFAYIEAEGSYWADTYNENDGVYSCQLLFSVYGNASLNYDCWYNQKAIRLVK